MFADLARLLGEIPHDDVAVQWDVAVEFGVLESAFGPDGDQAFEPVIAALVRCIDQVPPTSRPGCTCATATTAITISSSQSRWPCKSGC